MPEEKRKQNPQAALFDNSKSDEAVSDESGNAAEIARYFALSQPRLRAYIRSIVFNSSDVDDILQDVATIAIKNAAKFDPSRSASAWVMGIAKNQVLKYLDKQRTQKVCFSAELVEVITSSAVKNQRLETSLDELQSCLGKMDSDKKELLLKRHSPGVTARMLAREIGYTDTRMSRLLDSLYAVLMRCIEQEVTKV
jgi:RNA polymerase sigma-70 factor, ECF subfamily